MTIPSPTTRPRVGPENHGVKLPKAATLGASWRFSGPGHPSSPTTRISPRHSFPGPWGPPSMLSIRLAQWPRLGVRLHAREGRQQRDHLQPSPTPHLLPYN